MKITIVTDAPVIANFPPRASRGAVALIAADHELTDDKGRRVSGIARIAPLDVGGFGVKLFALRSGQLYGASPTKLSARAPDLATAIAAAERALGAQGKRYAAKFPIGYANGLER